MDPIDTLLNTSDPLQRGRAHLTLGRQALERGRPEVADRHFNEALRLMPKDPEARQCVHLSRVSGSSPPAPRRGWFKGWLRP